MDSITVQYVKDKYSGAIDALNLPNDKAIEIAIEDAKNDLECEIELDTSFYGEDNLKIWWRELTYYFLFSKGEIDRMVEDKRLMVFEQIRKFKANCGENIDASDYPYGYMQTAEEEILPEEDVLEWE